MAERIPIAFLAGVISVLTPCVLPLVPGYLTAVSSVEASKLGEKGVARRIAIASIPFMAGFTVVFVALGAGSAAIATVLDINRRNAIAGFILVVLGLVFMGLIPWPERVMGAGLLGKARQRESNALLGAAFAVCAAPCIGPVLASVLVLASSSSTVLRGSVLLFAYSLGIGVAFLLAGIAFARAMGAFRWVRDHYTVIRMISGMTLIALGLLLFFGKDWWLHVWLNRALDAVGLGSV
ncbi:MAG TPA: cytochrome c biogenesis protein CcdA [Gaiellaceae bacterium]|jgi:cytochrome c-type biogenesis protein|nr:cytochrome c biogenesis protein CcdA [Gaiellaceae bacterium]